jgi:hypothetical protein
MKAGYDAYYAAESGGYFGANFKPHPRTPPYTKNPQRAQWMKGWQIAQKNHAMGVQFSYDPFVGMDLGYLGKTVVVDKQREFQRKQAEFRAKQKQKQKFIPVSRPTGETLKKVEHTPWLQIKHKRTAPVETPAISFKRLDKFNSKHRTKV